MIWFGVIALILLKMPLFFFVLFCWIVTISIRFLIFCIGIMIIDKINNRELEKRRRLRDIWLQQQLLLKEEFKMLVMTPVAFVLKSFAIAIHQLYVVSLVNAVFSFTHFWFIFLFHYLSLSQLTSCKHEYHLQCILEW